MNNTNESEDTPGQVDGATPKPCPTPKCIARAPGDWPPDADHAELMDNRVVVKFFHPPRHSGGESRWWVICQTCGLRTPERADRAEVVALWNRLEFVPEQRHDTPDPEAALQWRDGEPDPMEHSEIEVVTAFGWHWVRLAWCGEFKEWQLIGIGGNVVDHVERDSPRIRRWRPARPA